MVKKEGLLSRNTTGGRAGPPGIASDRRPVYMETGDLQDGRFMAQLVGVLAT